MTGAGNRIANAYNAYKSTINGAFDRAGLNHTERLAFWVCVATYIIGYVVGITLLVGPLLINEDIVCVVLQVLCAVFIMYMSYRFLMWSGSIIAKSAYKRKGWKYEYGYHDFAEMEKEIAELRIQNTELREKLTSIESRIHDKD